MDRDQLIQELKDALDLQSKQIAQIVKAQGVIEFLAYQLTKDRLCSQEPSSKAISPLS